MRITVLIDNLPHPENTTLLPEWGLSLYLEYEGHTFLLDTGAGGQFAQNAAALGLSLDKAEFGVLSHAHFDHADGMDSFFRCNAHAPFYLQAACGENCYDKEEEGWHYAGIRKGLLAAFSDRLRYVNGKQTLLPGVHLLPHTTPGLAQVGIRSRMYLDTPEGWIPDDFRHEQSLVLETEKGLVVFNSCSHAGADNILKEASEAFPGVPLYAIIGGFHLFETPDEEVLSFARRLDATGVQHILTGHCTGDRAFSILQSVSGKRVRKFYTGLVLDL